ncbi:MAG: hypothetical protein DLM55_08760 [Acidimicrobiales bacterium]|nr:MAG: hypothetical protein DLM55_08760 [Acidimicrobiales bacterium]
MIPILPRLAGLLTVTQWRLRIGDWRILYDVYEDVLVVDVVRVGPRGDVYK